MTGTIVLTNALDSAQTTALSSLFSKVVQFFVSIIYTLADYTVTFFTTNTVAGVVAAVILIGLVYSRLRGRTRKLGV